VLRELRQKANELIDMLENYHRYDYSAISEKLEEIESVVDAIITNLRGAKLTDLKYKVFTDMLANYNGVVQALRTAIYTRDFYTARKRLDELLETVRNLYRHLSYLSGEIYLPTQASELEVFIPKEEVAERYEELDARLRRASHVARIIFAKLLDSPLREINLEHLPFIVGITDRRLLSRAVEELRFLLPDVVAVVPDIRRGGVKLVLKR
jgi:tetrahydromethanopterin S-methyltransferase subunit G